MRNTDKIKDLTGNKYNMLTVIGLASRDPVRWKCKCDCGGTTLVTTGNLTHGRVKSCGCLSHIGNPTHHMRHTKLYSKYAGILRRCYNQNEKCYKNYGGRGIKVCDEWKDSFMPFYEWAMENGYEDGLTIDRIDNDGDYCPDNCRWVDNATQANNRRSNLLYTMNGKTMNLTQWCKEYDLSFHTVRQRIKNGWPFEEAITFKGDARKKRREK